MSSSFLQYPPDADGKRVRHSERVGVVVASELIRPREGDVVVGVTSAASGTFTGASRSDLLEYYLRDVIGTFAPNEPLAINGDTCATLVSAAEGLYTPSVCVCDPDTPEHAQKIDRKGAAFSRFSEGEVQFDASGRVQVGQGTPVGEYYFTGEDRPEQYWTDVANAGTVTFEPNKGMVCFSTGTASGARSARTTHIYHPLKPGTGQLSMTAVQLGDTGKANLKRSWGYFDEYDGWGFRLNGTTLQVFLRSSFSGVVVEHVVNQADWSHERLNDADTDEYVLDLTKSNVFWSDLVKGSGRLRMGVFAPSGRRIVCHHFENTDPAGFSFVRCGNLPLRWEQENTGSVISTSEMRVAWGTVVTESFDTRYSGRPVRWNTPTAIACDSSGYKPVISFRQKLLIDGWPNRIIAIHEAFDMSADGDGIHVAVIVNPSYTGAAWSSAIIPESSLEVDTSATAITGGTIVEGFTIGPNGHSRIEFQDKLEKALRLLADGTQTYLTIGIKCTKPGGTSSFFFDKYWKEIR